MYRAPPRGQPLTGRMRPALTVSITCLRTLWRELSAYTTTGDLNDIEAAIARNGDAEADPQTQEIRRFLAARRNAA